MSGHGTNVYYRSLCYPRTKKFGDPDLTNKVRFLLSVADFDNHAKFAFLFMASLRCLQVCNCNKIIKTT